MGLTAVRNLHQNIINEAYTIEFDVGHILSFRISKTVLSLGNFLDWMQGHYIDYAGIEIGFQHRVLFVFTAFQKYIDDAIMRCQIN